METPTSLHPRRSAWPAGLMGMIVLVVAVELSLADRAGDFTTPWASSWSWSRQAVVGEAKQSRILCFGDSLMIHGVLPNIIGGRLGRPAYNLAVFKGQAASSYFLLRGALDAGTRPEAVLVDGELLEDDPLGLTRLWPELATLSECADMAIEGRSPDFLAAMLVAKALPSYKVRFEIRAAVMDALGGRLSPTLREVRSRRRNARRNLGAQVLPSSGFAPGQDPRESLLASYSPGPWKGHPVNVRYVERFLALAASRGIAVFWLLPPYHPGVQAARMRGGWSRSYADFVAGLQARHPNLTVIDGLEAYYHPEAVADMTHLNRLGAVAFSEAVADVVAARLGKPPDDSPRWVKIPHCREPAAPGPDGMIASTSASSPARGSAQAPADRANPASRSR